MKVQFKTAMSLLVSSMAFVAASAFAASPADIDAANSEKLDSLVGDLCYQTALNVAAESTDSTEDTTDQCKKDHPAGADVAVASVNKLIHGICVNAADYNDDYQNNDEGLSDVKLAAFKNKIIKECFATAKDLRATAGL